MSDVDVVVVGAGLAGLVAAEALDCAGAEVAVFEAAGTVGGRTRTVRVGAELVELGGEWVGSAHRRLLSVVDRLGLHLEPAGQLGRPVLWRDERSQSVRRLPPIRGAASLRTLRALGRATRLAKEIDPVEPWLGNAARVADADTFGTWMRREGVVEPDRALLDALAGSLASRPADELSLLHPLWWIARAGGLAAALRTTFQFRIAEGAAAICDALVRRLSGPVRLSSPVITIEQGGSGIRITTEAGEELGARAAIVTAQPGGPLGRIAFDPPLPEPQRRIDALAVAAGVKISALLPSGARPRHRAVLGGRPLQAAWLAGGHVTGFAPPASASASDAELAADLGRCFGLEPTDLAPPIIQRWGEEPAIGACDLGFAPGDLTGIGPHLRSAHGRVRFAGAERGSWPNNMEGAVESGMRVAAEISSEVHRAGS